MAVGSGQLCHLCSYENLTVAFSFKLCTLLIVFAGITVNCICGENIVGSSEVECVLGGLHARLTHSTHSCVARGRSPFGFWLTVFAP